jgi:hypothetical protein
MNTDKKTEVRSTVEALSVEDTLKLALEALENSRSLEPVDVQWVKGKRHAAITAIRAALASKSEALAHAPTEREQSAPVAEPHKQQEPIAWIERDMNCDEFDPDSVTCQKPDTAADGWEWVALYGSPQIEATPLASQRSVKPWAGLTEQDRLDIWKKSSSIDGAINATAAKLKEKNA